MHLRFAVVVVALSAAAASCAPRSFDVSPDVCGDYVVTGAEECDDGNTLDGDGCSASCKLDRPASEDFNEAEPDNTPPGVAYHEPWLATIFPDGDVDVAYYASNGGNVFIASLDPSTGACPTSPATSLAFTGVDAPVFVAGPMRCTTSIGGVTGPFSVAIQAAAPHATFSYDLEIITVPSNETEPNDTQPNDYSCNGCAFRGRVYGDADVDSIRVHPTSGTTMKASIVDDQTHYCGLDQSVAMHLEIKPPSGATVSKEGHCPSVSAPIKTPIQAADYYVVSVRGVPGAGAFMYTLEVSY